MGQRSGDGQVEGIHKIHSVFSFQLRSERPLPETFEHVCNFAFPNRRKLIFIFDVKKIYLFPFLLGKKTKSNCALLEIGFAHLTAFFDLTPGNANPVSAKAVYFKILIFV